MFSKPIKDLVFCFTIFIAVIVVTGQAHAVVLSPTAEPVAVDQSPFGTADLFGAGGFAITAGFTFIDAPLYYFDLGSPTASVSSAALTFNAASLFGRTEIQISVFADDGVSQLSDYEFFPTPIDVFTYAAIGVRMIDVTAAVNSVIPGQFLGFQFQSTLDPNQSTNLFEGVQFNGVSLEINGAAPRVPEPSTIALFGLGLAGLGFARRKKA